MKVMQETPLDRRALYDVKRVLACIQRCESKKLAEAYPGLLDPFDGKPIRLSPWNSSYEVLRMAKLFGCDYVTRGRLDRLIRLGLLKSNDRFEIYYEEEQNEVA